VNELDFVLLCFKHAPSCCAFLFALADHLLIFGNAKQKSHTVHVVLVNLTFNKSHLGMPMVTKRHFITINISPERQLGNKGKGTGGQVFPMLLLWCRPWIGLSLYCR